VNVVGVTKKDLGLSLEKWLDLGELDSSGLVTKAEKAGRWEILRNSFKPYPCGIVIHPVIDGCVQLHQEMVERGLEVKDIKNVKAEVHPLVLELTGKRKPKDGLEGKFSVYHGGAIGLIYGKGTPSQYEDAVVQDPNVIAVRDRIDAEAINSLGADETKIEVTMNDGTMLEKHVVHAVGSLEVPMDDRMLEEKFRDQCVGVLGDGEVEEASRALWDIEKVEDMSALAAIL